MRALCSLAAVPQERPPDSKRKRVSVISTIHPEGNVLFNDALNTFYLRLYFVRHMVKDSERVETPCGHMGYSFRLAARVLLYASTHIQDNTYHGLCYTSGMYVNNNNNNNNNSENSLEGLNVLYWMLECFFH